MDHTTAFECADCGAQYKVVRAEASPQPTENEKKVACLTCGAPLGGAREGQFVLKYFRVKRSRRHAEAISRA